MIAAGRFQRRHKDLSALNDLVKFHLPEAQTDYASSLKIGYIVLSLRTVLHMLQGRAASYGI
jgi:hypothetical protein